MGDTSTDLIDLSSIEQSTLNNPISLVGNSVSTISSGHRDVSSCDSIKPNQNDHASTSFSKVPHSSDQVFNDFQVVGSSSYTSRRTKDRIDEFEAQLECFMKTKKLLLEQFAEETQNLTKKHEREILGLRQKHLVCENNFKSQLENSLAKIEKLEAKIESDQATLKIKIEFYEEELRKYSQEAKVQKEELESEINGKEKHIDELKKLNLNLESKFKLLSSEFKTHQQQSENKILNYELNQERDLQELKKLREELNYSLKEISSLQRDMDLLKEKLSQKEKQCFALEGELDNYKKQIKLETEFKKESSDKIQSLEETLKVSQTVNESLQQKVTEIQSKLDEEIENLKSQMSDQQKNYEQIIRKKNEDNANLEKKFRSETVLLEKNLQDSRKQCEDLKEELRKITLEKQKLQQEFENKIEKLSAGKKSSESLFDSRLNGLNKKISDLEQKLQKMTEKCQLSQNELLKAQNYIVNIENDLKSKNSEILNVHEKYNLLEMDRLAMLKDLEDVKRLLHLETVEKKEKLRQIEDLNESLSSSQIEIEKLKNVNEQLKRSIEDGDNLRFTLLKDCSELRETLAEVEKSRLEIKSKLNSCQFSCASLNNQLKKKELELDDLKRKLNTYGEEKKLWQQDLDSTSQSLTQMKAAYERLYQQNVLLQNKLSQLESETNHKIVEVKSSPNDKESLKRLTRECEQSRDRIAKLESEKKHFERLYINIEREYNNLKSSLNPNSGMNFLNARSPSPNLPETAQKKSDYSASVLSLTQLLKSDLSNVNPFNFDDDLSTNRSLETLRQKQIELKQKVLSKQNTHSLMANQIDNGNKSKTLDYCDCIYHHQNNPSAIGDNDLLYDFNNENFDENRNNIDLNFENDNSFDEKLKVAEMNAQKVLESCEPEIRKLSNKSRIKSSHHKSHHCHQSVNTEKK